MKGTKVRISAFTLDFSENLGFGDFYQQLEIMEKKEIKLFQGRRCVLLTDVSDDYVVGLALNYRDDKRNVITKINKKSELEVIKNSLKKNEHNTEATVFCLNPKTRMGLFYSYMGGGNIYTLKKLFQTAHRKAWKCLVKEKAKELTQLNQNADKKKCREKAENFYSGNFTFNIKMQQKDIDDLIKIFGQIDALEVSVDHLIGNIPEFSPVNHLQKRSKLSFLVADQFRKSNISQNIKDLHKKFSGHGNASQIFKIVGKSLSGEEISGIIGDNIEDFGTMSYDSYIEKLPDDIWDNYKSSASSAAIQSIMSNKKAIFGKTTKKETWKIPSAKDI